MRKPAHLAAALAAAALAATVPAPALAGQTIVRLCAGPSYTPPGARPGWSTVTTGGAIYPSAVPVAWADSCSRPRAGGGTWNGAGGAFGDSALPGSTAFLRFTPPAGSTIDTFQATENWSLTSESYAEAGTFTSTGRWLDPGLNSTGQGTAGYDAAALGPDGAAGLLLGARCPASLPAGIDSCGGAGAAFTEGRIYLNDPSPGTLTATGSVDGAGNVTVAWSASDPQSGISGVRVGPRSPGAPPTQAYPCSDLSAPVCPATVTGSTVAGQLAPGQTGSYLVTASPTGGQDVEQVVTVARAGDPAPTTPPPTTPGPTTPGPTTPPPTTPQGDPKPTFKVSLNTKAVKGRKLRLSGTAKGCSRVKIKPPRKGTYFATVNKKGQWSRTVARKRGTYTALCGTARAKRTAR